MNTLTEHITDWNSQLQVDRAGRVVRNVALTGGRSKNGYRYSEPALRRAVPLYENKPVFLDHAGDRSRPHERSTRDLVGTIVNPRYDGGRIRGDIRVMDTDSGRTFLSLVESKAPGVGMSHVVLAERSPDDATVEQIREVVSVDAVVFPATTHTFRESQHVSRLSEAGETEQHGSDAGEMLPACADASQADPAALQEAIALLQAERDELRRELDTLRAREVAGQDERRLHRQIAAAGLPSEALSELFVRQLRSAGDAERVALLSERRQLIEQTRRHSPLSTERRTQAPDTSTQFVAAIRRHR
jgi:hypothetical protein